MATRWAVQDQPLTLFICSTEYCLSANLGWGLFFLPLLPHPADVTHGIPLSGSLLLALRRRWLNSQNCELLPLNFYSLSLSAPFVVRVSLLHFPLLSLLYSCEMCSDEIPSKGPSFLCVSPSYLDVEHYILLPLITVSFPCLCLCPACK